MLVEVKQTLMNLNYYLNKGVLKKKRHNNNNVSSHGKLGCQLTLTFQV